MNRPKPAEIAGVAVPVQGFRVGRRGDDEILIEFDSPDPKIRTMTIPLRLSDAEALASHIRRALAFPPS